MVAGSAAQAVEVFQTLGQSTADVVGCVQLFLSHAAGQRGKIFNKSSFVDVDGFVGAEGRIDLHGDRVISSDFFMPFQSVGGIVGGADHGHMGTLQDPADGESGLVLEFVIAEVPGFLCGVRSQRFVITEEVEQLQMTPVVHGVSDGKLQRFHEFQETLEIRLISGDVIFADAVGAHETPLVMVAEIGPVGIFSTQPDFS